jgi:hypothetical protein
MFPVPLKGALARGRCERQRFCVRYFFRRLVLLEAAAEKRILPSTASILRLLVQTVSKVRTAGNQVVVLEERLNSIFEMVPSARWGWCKATAVRCGIHGACRMVCGGLCGTSLRQHFGDSHYGYGCAPREAGREWCGSERPVISHASAPSDPFFNYAGDSRMTTLCSRL